MEPTSDTPADKPSHPDPAEAGTSERAGARRTAPQRSARTFVGAGIGALAIVGAAVVGVHALGTPSTADAAGRRAAVNGAPRTAGPDPSAGLPDPSGGMQDRRPRPPGTMGQITSISGSTIVVQDALTNASVTVHTTSSTTVRGTATSLSALQVGDRIRAEGATAADGSVTAVEIHVGDGPMGAGGRPPGGPDEPRETTGSTATT